MKKKRIERIIVALLIAIAVNLLAGLWFIYGTKMDYWKCFCLYIAFIFYPSFMFTWGFVEDQIKRIRRRKSK